MSEENQDKLYKPVVLALAGHDPSGGAGIQADIETVTAHGCVATSVITSLTTQNTQVFESHQAQTRKAFDEQCTLLLEDINIDACKIGAIGSAELIEGIHSFAKEKSFPFVLDPILHSTTGHHFSNEETCELLINLLFPLMTVITPNRDEAMQLTGEIDPGAAAEKLFSMGCQNILITDAEDSEQEIINYFFQSGREHQTYTYERLAQSYHGSGCTLSSAIAAKLAKGVELDLAVEQAQDYTWNTIKHGIQVGKGQMQPNRFHHH